MKIDDVSKYKEEAKLLLLEMDPMWNDITRTTEIVKEYIRSHPVVIYGGTAIDMFLRLKGDKIYPDEMLAAADLDFLSGDSVGDAYFLAKKFFDMGYKEARAIRAIFPTTMKVDIGGNHWLADCSYVPQEICKNIIAHHSLEFDGMKIVHPDLQRIDLHSALAFPYDNPPREVMFDRWKKDIERFNLLNKHYPVEQGEIELKMSRQKWPMKIRELVLSGWAAYAIYRQQRGDKDAFVVSDSGVSFDSPMKYIDCVGHRRLSYDVTAHHVAYGHIIPEWRMYEANYGEIREEATDNRLLSFVSVTIGDKKWRLVCIQYLLRYFISMAIKAKWDDDIPKYKTALFVYSDLLSMCSGAHPFGLSAKVYGDLNQSITYETAVAYYAAALKRFPPEHPPDFINDVSDVLPVMPQNYNPGKNAAMPTFDYATSHLFQEDGRAVR